jgi:hypothetical protein
MSWLSVAYTQSVSGVRVRFRGHRVCWGRLTDELSRAPDERHELVIIETPHASRTCRLLPVRLLDLAH